MDLLGRTLGATQGIPRRRLGSLEKETTRTAASRYVVHKVCKSRRHLKNAAFMSRSSRLAQTPRCRAALQKTSRDRYRELGHVVTGPPRAILSLTRNLRF